jgi:hypothetical protein
VVEVTQLAFRRSQTLLECVEGIMITRSESSARGRLSLKSGLARVLVRARVDGHASLGSMLEGKVKQDGVVLDRLLRDRVHFRDLVEIRLLLGVSGLLFRYSGALHLLAKVWDASQEEGVVIRVAITSLRAVATEKHHVSDEH